ncbi:MAG: FIG028593: membrane protein [uncultured Acetobacteraceae bacterium]|uniref:FIG028593: membrane protein n=1 Tax=uncultured Acetobacteraceae bacterium TaxID=169975 RepID=A0A6J4JHY9_9PROT|nr:MAG: FIG028593: membrane protein [uncultured Acetobacteraceae bacterium]
MSGDAAREAGAFPVSAGVLFGLGLGGFFDGIVLHQVLQWHHMLTSAGYPADSVANLRINTLADGLFHASTYAFVAAGLAVLWRSARRTHLRWSGKLLVGTLLMGFGLFNLVEGVVDHHLLGIHHVNETVPRDQWIYWDLGFLLWGAAMLVGGWSLLRAGRRETPGGAAAAVPGHR